MKFTQLIKQIEKIKKGKLNGYAIRLDSKEMELYAEGNHPYPLTNFTLIVDCKEGKFNKFLDENMHLDAHSNQKLTVLYTEPDDQRETLLLMEHIQNDTDRTNESHLNFINGESSPLKDLNFICLFWRYGMDSTLLVIRPDKNKKVHFSTLRSNNIRLTTILFNLTQAFSNSNGTLIERLQ